MVSIVDELRKSPSGDSILVLGFRGLVLYLLELESNAILFSVNCRGGNRPLDFEFRSPSRFAVAYSFGDCLALYDSISTLSKSGPVKGEKEEISTTPNDEEITGSLAVAQRCTVVVPSLHGKEILAVSVVHDRLNGREYIVTASELTDVKISEFCVAAES